MLNLWDSYYAEVGNFENLGLNCNRKEVRINQFIDQNSVSPMKQKDSSKKQKNRLVQKKNKIDQIDLFANL